MAEKNTLFSNKKTKNVEEAEILKGYTWRILVVDDEEDVHSVTKLALKNVKIDKMDIELLDAYSAKEAKEIFLKYDDISVVLLDVVMESDDAGLDFVKFVRNEIKNPFVRIILRTGQPGQAPEKDMIEKYDINDYKEKTELTITRLYTVVRTSIMTYKNLINLKQNRDGLDLIISSSPSFIKISSFETFFKGVLLSVSSLLGGISSWTNKSPNVLVYMKEHKRKDGELCFGVGKFENINISDEVISAIIDKAKELFVGLENSEKNSCSINFTEDGGLLTPIFFEKKILAFIFIEGPLVVGKNEANLLTILLYQISIAFKNMLLYQEILKQNDETIMMLATASEYKDSWTGEHVMRIKDLSIKIALELGIEKDVAEEIGRSSVLHDIGKIAIDEKILKKCGSLSIEEFEEVKHHTEKGSLLLNHCESFNLASEIAMSHHEKYDGSGYPKGLKGDEIPISGRIIAVADVFDALTHERPYKDAWKKEDAIKTIQENSGTHFDPNVVNAFLILLEKGEL